MLKANQLVKVRWNNKNRKYYETLGYLFTSNKDEFEVDIEDLTKSSKAEVIVICDYCGKEIRKKYQTYNMQHSDKFGDACKDCQPKKNERVCIDKYGVSNGALTDSAKEKQKNTNINRYGVSNVFELKEFQDKAKETKIDKYGSISLWDCEESVEKRKATMLDRYGVLNSFESDDIKKKIEQTNIERYGFTRPTKNETVKAKVAETNRIRYGVDNYSKTEECKDKIKTTNLQKYGYEHTLQVPEIRQKGMETMLKEDEIPTSKQQIAIRDILMELYGNCELNKIVGICALDCVVNVNGQQIDIEYDGWYWHKDKQGKDRARDEVMKNNGYKILRILSNKDIPTKEEIKEKIDTLLTTDATFQRINMV